VLASGVPANGGSRHDDTSVLCRGGARQTVSAVMTAFPDDFSWHGHAVVPSSLLVPHDDPSLLLTAHGVVQFATALDKIAGRGGKIGSTSSTQRGVGLLFAPAC
jgi:hypothetical protein